MKRLLLALVAVLILAAPDSAFAQFADYTQTNLDSLTGIRGRTITDGFGAYKYIEDGVKARDITGVKTLWVDLPGITDSVAVEGGVLRTNHATGLKDTVWSKIALRHKITSKTGIDNRGAFTHDTTVYWMTNVGLDLGRTRTAVLDDPHEFIATRIVTGINDTTKTKFRLQGRKD
jgi:hypothetical protein